MAQLTVISREQHANKRWKRYTSYTFAAKDAVAPLVVQELPRACMNLPIGFVKNENGYQLVAVQGLKPGKNLWVASDGRWLGGYVPAAYRGHPFALASAEDGRRVLCVREESGLIGEHEGEPFFDEEGRPSKPVQEVLNFLEQVSNNAQLTAQLCELLDEYALIQPWALTLRAGETEQKVEGLFKVDEQALNALPIDQLDALRRRGALPMVYCQLLSMQHLQRLGQLADQHAAAATIDVPDSGELDLEFLRDDGNIRFS